MRPSEGIILAWNHHDVQTALDQLSGRHYVLLSVETARAATELIRRGMVGEHSYFYTFAADVGETLYWERWLDENHIPIKRRGWLTV